MNSKTFWPILALVASLIAPVLGRGQIIDGRAQLDTPHYVSQLVPYPIEAIRLVIPRATVTSIVNGDTLAGTDLRPPEPMTLGVPGLATLKVDWEYTAKQMADGSGTAILLKISAVPALLGQGVGSTADYIVMRPEEVAQKFKDRNAAISAVLYSMYFVYYNGGNTYGFSGGYAYSMLPYTTWYVFYPPGTVLIGPTVFINVVP